MTNNIPAIEQIRTSNPELYSKLVLLAAQLNSLPRRERRMTERKILKMLKAKQ